MKNEREGETKGKYKEGMSVLDGESKGGLLKGRMKRYD